LYCSAVGGWHLAVGTGAHHAACYLLASSYYCHLPTRVLVLLRSNSSSVLASSTSTSATKKVQIVLVQY
jgi:hypothetical protein